MLSSQLQAEHLEVIAFNLLSAVEWLHASDVIHRDIKPSNILINQNLNVNLCDFGLARTLGTKE